MESVREYLERMEREAAAEDRPKIKAALFGFRYGRHFPNEDGPLDDDLALAKQSRFLDNEGDLGLVVDEDRSPAGVKDREDKV